MMKKVFCFLHVMLGAVILLHPAHAQEFNAPAEQALSTQISTLRNMLQAMHSEWRQEQAQTKFCAAKLMLYAPDTENADGDGCVAVHTHMHWNQVDGAGWTVYDKGNTTKINAITTGAPLCSSVGESPVQMNFCSTWHKSCYTRIEAKQNCTNRGSGTGCNGNPTPGSVKLWLCM